MELPKLKKRKAEVPVDPNCLVSLSTNFDYLNGAFSRAEHGRQAIAVIALVGLIVASGAGLLGVQAQWETATDHTSIGNATRVNATVQTQLDSLDQAGGIPADTLRTHNQSRFAAYKNAVGAETDLSRLLTQVAAAAPQGVTLTSVALSDPAPTAAAGSAPSATPTPAATPAPSASASPGATQASGTAGSRTLTVTGLATDFTKIGSWTSALGAVPGVVNPQPSWTGGGNTLTVTITATITDALRSARALDVDGSDIYGLVRATTVPPGSQPSTQRGQ